MQQLRWTNWDIALQTQYMQQCHAFTHIAAQHITATGFNQSSVGCDEKIIQGNHDV